MRLELYSNETAGISYLLNEIGIGILIALIFVNIYGVYFMQRYAKKKKKILTWQIVIDAALLIAMLFLGIVVRTTFQ